MESKNKSTVLTNFLTSLPTELIYEEILTRLPVKPLLKFKCVCKSWLLLISSSYFVKTHLASTKSKNYDNYSLVLMTIAKDGLKRTYFTCNLSHAICNTGSIDLNVLDFHVENGSNIQLRGICNGLLYIIIDSRKFGLYNPATRKFKFFPPLSIDDGYDESTGYGFCYDEVNDDYKIIELYVASTNTKMSKIHAYSLRNDSWTTIVYPNRIYLTTIVGTCIGRVIYWTIINADGRSYSILSVDTTAYTYSTVAGPKLDNGYYIDELSLGAFGGCLVANSICFRKRVDVWAMKESWIKIASIPFPLGKWSVLRWPPFVLDNGEIFLEYVPYETLVKKTSINVMVCNLREKSFVNHEIHHNTNHMDLHVLHSLSYPVYFESLVTPSFDGE